MKNVNILRDVQMRYEEEMDRKDREQGMSEHGALEDVNVMFEAYRREQGESASRTVGDKDVMHLAAVNEALLQQNIMLTEKLKR